MRKIIYSVCIGTLALAVTAWGQQANDNRRPARAKPQQRAASVHAARPANSGAAMGARHYNSTAQFRQRPQMTAPRARSNAVVNQNQMRVSQQRNRNQEFRARRPTSAPSATVRERNLAMRPVSTTPATVRARNNVAVNRERNLAASQMRNAQINRNRNANEFRGRRPMLAPSATVRNRNVAVNRTTNAAFYRGRNVAINNNFRSAAFRGPRYTVFRNYQRRWHDRGWWRSHFNRIIFVSGGWWYWNAGYWFPAWGYAADAYYPYDGPIYGYNGMSPDQITVDVQQQLQADGYYDGPIDGVLGPMTREAIAAFQADNGLSATSVIDEPTLDALGIA